MKTKLGKFHFKSRKEKYNEGLTLGLLLGTAIGACAALLLLPKSGKNAKKRLKDEAERQAGKLSKHWDQLKGQADDAASDAKDTLESTGRDAKSKLDDYKDKAEDALHDGKETIVDKLQKHFK